MRCRPCLKGVNGRVSFDAFLAKIPEFLNWGKVPPEFSSKSSSSSRSSRMSLGQNTENCVYFFTAEPTGESKQSQKTAWPSARSPTSSFSLTFTYHP